MTPVDPLREAAEALIAHHLATIKSDDASCVTALRAALATPAVPPEGPYPVVPAFDHDEGCAIWGNKGPCNCEWGRAAVPPEGLDVIDWRAAYFALADVCKTETGWLRERAAHAPDDDAQRRCWTVYAHAEGTTQCGLYNGHDGVHHFGTASTPEGLDVERLARAMADESASRDGTGLGWTSLNGSMRDLWRTSAARIAREYQRLPDTGDTPKEPTG